MAWEIFEKAGDTWSAAKEATYDGLDAAIATSSNATTNGTSGRC